MAKCDHQIEEIKTLYYERGFSAAEVAKHLNVHIKVIYKAMAKFGLKRRTSAESNLLVFNRKPLSFSLKEKLIK
jgi:transposase